MSTAVLLDTLLLGGFEPRLYWPPPDDPVYPQKPPPRLLIGSGEPLPADLRQVLVDHRDELKAVLLLADPPEWLAQLLDLYTSGRETAVRRSDGHYTVRVSLKNIAAAVAAEVGASATEWERFLPDVEARVHHPGELANQEVR